MNIDDRRVATTDLGAYLQTLEYFKWPYLCNALSTSLSQLYVVCITQTLPSDAIKTVDAYYDRRVDTYFARERN